MELIKPDVGLIFWMIISFSLVFFILKKAAWKPVLTALKDRESSIDEALSAAERAKKEMEQLQVDNEKIIAQARQERDKLIKEAKDIKDKFILEAYNKAAEEANRLIENARQNIRYEKEAALDEIKVQIAHLSVQIAEKILRQKLNNKESQKELINSYLKDVKMN